jgi:HK97 family phage portal protein
MGAFDRLAQFLSIAPMQQRSLGVVGMAPVEDQIASLRRPAQPWRLPSIAEALSIPANLRAVTLIANVTGSLSLEAFRNGARIDDRPRVIVRPNPKSTPRAFYGGSAFCMATYGEIWYWIAKRDQQGNAAALWPINPIEIRVEPNQLDVTRPKIYWGQKLMPNDDMRQVRLVDVPGSLRGAGPLQMCGAAVSVAVEAQEWAANFFADGGYPSIVMTSEDDLDEDESTRIKERWTQRAPNTPYLKSQGLSVEAIEVDESGAQMLEARLHQNGESALMFGIPGTLLEHGVEGGSITYQNVAGEFDKFVRGCLWPNYLEPIEQVMSDLLPFSDTARFNVDALLRPDAKTRYEIYKLGTEAGLPWVRDMAAQQEGIEPGDVELMPVPFAPAAATPAPIPMVQRSDDTPQGLRELRCPKCNWLTGRVAGPAEIKCRKCGELATAA